MSGLCLGFRAGRVTEYLEGTLTPAEADVLEFHLLTCAPCAELLHRYRQVVSSLRRLGPR